VQRRRALTPAGERECIRRRDAQRLRTRRIVRYTTPA
jgi:hypothetical protein